MQQADMYSSMQHCGGKNTVEEERTVKMFKITKKKRKTKKD